MINDITISKMDHLTIYHHHVLMISMDYLFVSFSNSHHCSKISPKLNQYFKSANYCSDIKSANYCSDIKSDNYCSDIKSANYCSNFTDKLVLHYSSNFHSFWYIQGTVCFLFFK